MQEKKVALFKNFVKWTQTEFKDVWYVTNQQLIQWIRKPTPVDKMLDFLPCRPPAMDVSNIEICDGIDNNGDGIIDNGVVETCQVTEEVSFRSCYGCPTLVPNVTNPVPPQKGTARKPMPDAGCPNDGTWNPIDGVCVTLKRPAVKLPEGGNTSTAKPDSQKGNGASQAGQGMATAAVAGAAIVAAMALML